MRRFLHDLGFLLDDGQRGSPLIVAISSIPEASSTPCRKTQLRLLVPLTLQPLRLLLGFLSRDGTQNPGPEPTIGGPEVKLSRDVGECDAEPVGPDDEILELPGMSRQTVLVDNQDSIDHT